MVKSNIFRKEVFAMNRIFAVLSGLLVLPAFAEVAPISYEEIAVDTGVEMPVSDDATVAESDVVVVAPVAQPSVAGARGRTTASRTVPSSSDVASNRATASGRVVASTRGSANTVTSRAAATNRSVATRAATTRATVARSGATQVATTRAAMQSSPAKTARASIVQTDTVNKSLYSGNRVATRASAVRARAPIATTISVSNTETAVDSGPSMDELAQITDFCKAQYTSCMDNYCNVLDDNQGRCSCSKNIKNYEKTETALKQATEALQDVAQQIQYIGLTKDQINTLFAQTEAELAMSSSSDNSQLKNDLDRIKDLIVDVKGGSASSTTVTSGISMDLSGLLDFNIDSTGFDLSALFGGSSSNNTSSISNQRGEQLYKTAAARCKAAVLNDCSAQGVDISVITNSYDLEIDKQCLVYERNLKEANDNMSSTVRNAKNVLQRARLMVAQNKNAYDLRGCINALDSCMQDEYVCGTDYEYCLDPTGKYIVNGDIVIGSEPVGTNGLSAGWAYGDNNGSNAWESGTLSAYIGDSMLTDYNSYQGAATDNNIAKYLQYKIGYITDGKAYGMCASVLNQCQDYTYDDGEYNYSNNVVKSYLERTLVQIKAQQDELLASYAESCITDVTSCLADNGWSSSSTSISSSAQRACNGIITTCYSLTGTTESDNTDSNKQGWLNTIAYTPVDCVVADVENADEVSGTKRGSDTTGCKATKCKTGYSLTQQGTCGSLTIIPPSPGVPMYSTSTECSTKGGMWLGDKCTCLSGWESDNKCYKTCVLANGVTEYQSSKVLANAECKAKSCDEESGYFLNLDGGCTYNAELKICGGQEECVPDCSDYESCTFQCDDGNTFWPGYGCVTAEEYACLKYPENAVYENGVCKCLDQDNSPNGWVYNGDEGDPYGTCLDMSGYDDYTSCIEAGEEYDYKRGACCGEDEYFDGEACVSAS